MKTIIKSTKEPVKAGSQIVSFNGNNAIFLLAIRANEEGCDGKVLVCEDGSKHSREFYARVFDLEVLP